MMERPKDPGGSSTVGVDDQQGVAADTRALGDAAVRALAVLGLPASAGLDITLVDPDRMAELKRDALGVHRPTDVLSFPIDDPASPSPGPLMLGDIVLCPAVARGQARALGRTLDDELRALLVHGLLHLTGAGHDDVRAELDMAQRERAVLAAVGSGR
jgi:probable rRNA maturation factor